MARYHSRLDLENKFYLSVQISYANFGRHESFRCMALPCYPKVLATLMGPVESTRT